MHHAEQLNLCSFPKGCEKGFFQSATQSPLFLHMQVLFVLCAVAEYDELPVRHNEDKVNAALSETVRWPVDSRTVDDPHTKANLLLQVSCSLPAACVAGLI